jgi:iron complex transport system substrate-binding protein
MYRLLYLLIILLFVFALHARDLGDAKEQNSTVERVFGSSPPMNYLIYALNPDKMIGLNFKAKNPSNHAVARYLDTRFLTLPVIGSFHGGGQSINLETLIAHRPDLILLWEDDMMVRTVSSQIAKTGILTMTVPFREIASMPDAMERVGRAIKEELRGKELAGYSRKIIREVNTSVSAAKAARYYYAEGLDGLSTECDTSFHVVALNFAGGENVHKCRQRGLLGLEKISFETLLTYDPDVIIVQHPMVYADLVNDPLWQKLRAVKNGRIHLVPNTPFNWIDRPPSFMRVLGIQWLASLFHPERTAFDLKQRITEFYELFLHVKLTDADIQSLLGESL